VIYADEHTTYDRGGKLLRICVLVHLGETIEAKTYPNVTMLFSDIVGFTAICATATPMMVINMLQNLYEQFDLYCGQLDVYKVRYEVRVTKYIKDVSMLRIYRHSSYHRLSKCYRLLPEKDSSIQRKRSKCYRSISGKIIIALSLDCNGDTIFLIITGV